MTSRVISDVDGSASRPTGSDEHRCDRLPGSGVAVTYGQAFGDVRRSAWHLHLIREATEADLEESSVFHEVGESMWSVCAEIRCCPYCGVALADGDEDIEPVDGAPVEHDPYGAFALFDQERWAGRFR